MIALAIARKELADILRERSILVALLVQFFIAAFSAFLTVGLLGLYDPESSPAVAGARVGYIGPGGFDQFLDQPGLEWETYGTEEALALFEAGRLDAIVQETYDDANGTRRVTLLLPEGEVQGTLLVTRLKGLLQDYEAELRIERQDRLTQELIEVEQPSGRPPLPFGFLYGTLLPLLLLTPVFLCGAIAADSFVHEVQHGTLGLLRSAPATLGAVITGKLLVPLVLAPLQVLLWIGLLQLNGIPVAGVVVLLALAAVLALMLSGIGIAVAAAVRKQGPGQAAYALVALILAVASLLLPRDILNTIALTATDGLDAAGGSTLVLVATFAAAIGALGIWFAAVRVRRDHA